MQKLALLIDYENFPCPPEGLSRFLADFSQRGTLAVKRAYADWVKLPAARQQLLANQVEMIELPCVSKGKNSADIRLVVDAMELVFTQPHIDTYVVASGDADFLPLLSRLRAYNKQTIVVSRSRNLHGFMRTHCDEFINGDFYLTIKTNTGDSNQTTKHPEPKIKSPSPTPEQVTQIQKLILEAWQSHGVAQPFNVSILGSRLKKMNPALEWKDYGFKALQPLVAFLVTHGFLRIELKSQSANRIYLAHPSKAPSGTPATKTVITTTESETRTDDLAGDDGELVSSMRVMIHDRIRWDRLLLGLTQNHPKLMRGIQSEDAFLKQLQSWDASSQIDLQYDANEKTYFVSIPPTGRSVPHPLSDTESIFGDKSPVWTQPELF